MIETGHARSAGDVSAAASQQCLTMSGTAAYDGPYVVAINRCQVKGGQGRACVADGSWLLAGSHREVGAPPQRPDVSRWGKSHQKLPPSRL